MSPARPSRLRSFASRVEQANDRSAWTTTLLVVLAMYLLTAHWQSGQVSDSVAAIWPAWHFAEAGSVDLSTARGLPYTPWFVEVDGRVVSERMMGVLLAGLPLAGALRWSTLDAEQIGALTAATMTALAVANMHLVFRALVGRLLAAAAAMVLAFGTPLWTTAAAELWTHGPNALWLSCALLAASRGNHLLSGFALCPAVMTRPHLAVCAAALGVGLTLAERSWRPVLAVGLPSSAAVPALLGWNAWYYGALSSDASYEGRLSAATAAPGGSQLLQFAEDLVLALVSPAVGLLVYAPVIAVLLATAPHGWRTAPPWVRAAFVGAVLYQVVQLRMNRYSGGGGFYSNRLMVELVVLASPLWLVSARAWAERASSARARVLVLLASSGVAIHAFGAFSAYYWHGTGSEWWRWYPAVVRDAMGGSGWLLAAGVSLLPLLAVLTLRELAAQDDVTAEPVASPPAAARTRS